MLRITDAEVVGVTESSVTLALCAAGAPRAIRVCDREVTTTGALQLITVDGLEPATELALTIEADDAELPERDRYWPASVTTLAAPAARQVASFATVSDLHFGEVQFGGVPGVADDHLRADYAGEPYWKFMNRDAMADINAAGVDATIVKGDIADRGLPDELAIARATFETLTGPWHAFLGNHDAYGEADGYALLDQEPAPRAVEVGGFRLLFVDTVEPGHHRGRLTRDMVAWVDRELGRARDVPAILLMHHQPVPRGHERGLINSIGIPARQSEPLFEVVGRHRHVVAALIGHTHRNRVRRYPAARDVPFAEVGSTKDYPGVWAHYRLFADGSIRQEVRRISSPRALAHSLRCGRMFAGRYRTYALGALADRSWTASGPS